MVFISTVCTTQWLDDCESCGIPHDGTAKASVANVTDAADKEFNNTVTPPTEPKFQPEVCIEYREILYH